jgi:hypothetical protein
MDTQLTPNIEESINTQIEMREIDVTPTMKEQGTHPIIAFSKCHSLVTNLHNE